MSSPAIFPSFSGSNHSLPSGSTNRTGLLAQYVYGLTPGYLSDIGSTESQMERSEVPAKPEWRCRAAGGAGKWSWKWTGGRAWAGILICGTIDWSGWFF